MRTIAKRILSLLLLFAVLLTLLSGCSGEGSLELRMDISGGVNSLDPQFATDNNSRTIIANSFEGLLRKDGEGKTVPAVAASYKISDDGLHYTFSLRRDAHWSDGKTVVAQDFVFALRRLFHSQVPSPYAEEFMTIRNAPMVLSGELPQTLLGVTAKDDFTLEITLSQPSPLFLEKLCSTAAMPCNEEFFTSTRARYGLGTDYLNFNGAYTVSHWDNAKYIGLKPNRYYHTQNEIPSPDLYLYTSRVTETKTALDLFNEGKSDIYLSTAEELGAIAVKDAGFMEIKNRVWQLTFNTGYGALANPSLRRGLAMSLDSGGYTERIPAMYELASSLIPQSTRPQQMPLPQLLPYDPSTARAAIAAGLAETEQDSMPPLVITVPDGAQLSGVAGYLQRQWRDNLNLIVNLEVLPQKEFDARIAKRDFSLVIMPQEISGQDCADLLSFYTAASLRNHGGFADSEYEELLGNGIKAGSAQQSMKYYCEAEQLLIDRAAAIPLFTQSSYYAFSEGTTGVSLVGGLLEFKNARRTGG